MGEGERLAGRYCLLERLGTGGMAVVWRGFDEVLQRDVAIKVIAPWAAGDEVTRGRLHAEARAAARLSHPHIASVYDYGEVIVRRQPPSPFVVMELVRGESMSGRLAGGATMPWREAVTACAQVGAALASAHHAGVVHRDVTPGNVMLTGAGAKVVDFGISALVGDHEVGPEGKLLGTPAYLAPERLAGGEVDTAVDVYGLGVLLYRALSGALPWVAETVTEIVKAHQYADPMPLPPDLGVPREVSELVHYCIARDPHARPLSVEVAYALAETVGIALPMASRCTTAVSLIPGRPESLTIARVHTSGLFAQPAPTGRGRLAATLRRSIGQLATSGRIFAIGRRAISDLALRLPTLAVRVPSLALRLPGPALRGPGSAQRGVSRQRPSTPPLRLPGWTVQLPGWAAALRQRRAALVVLVAVLVVALTAVAAARTQRTAPSTPAGWGAVGAAPPQPACEVQYRVERDWRRGFSASVVTANTGDVSLKNATLRFAFPGDQRIERPPAGGWRQSGREVSAQLVARGRSLPPGESVNRRFTAEYQAANSLPTRFFLASTACKALVTGPAGSNSGVPASQAADRGNGKANGPGKGQPENRGKTGNAKHGERQTGGEYEPGDSGDRDNAEGRDGAEDPDEGEELPPAWRLLAVVEHEIAFAGAQPS